MPKGSAVRGTRLGITGIHASGTPSSSTFLRGDGAWGAISSLLTLVGSSATEATTTNGTDTNLHTIALSTNIAKTEIGVIVFTTRKASGAANDMRFRIGVNGGTYVMQARQCLGAANAAAQGSVVAFLLPHDANYTRSGLALVGGYDGTNANETVFAFEGTAMPDAAISSVQIDGRNNGGSITVGIANVHVFRLALS